MTFKKESFWGTVSYIIFLYLKNAPFKLLLEIIINVSKQVMVVITSVWLLKLLSEMIVNGMLFGDLIIPLVAVSAINIVINLGDSFYSNYVRPQNDLKIKVRFERQLTDHSNKLPLTVFENSDFYTVVEQAKEGVSVVFSAYNDFILIISQIAAVVSAVGVVISIDPLLLIFASFSVPMIILNKKTGVKIASKKMDLKYYERKETYAKEIWLKKEYVREFKTSKTLAFS